MLILEMHLPWFALASEHYLRVATNASRMPMLCCPARIDSTAFAFENETERFSQWPRLPKKAIFTSLKKDSFPDFLSIPELDYYEDRAMVRSVMKYLNSDEFVERKEYVCLGHTNIGEATFPLRFEFKEYHGKVNHHR